MSEHPFGWLSILPPVIAIVLAILTRRVVTSLFAGIFVGALVLAGGDPWQALVATLHDHLWNTLIDEDKLHVLAFTCLMGAMVGIVNRSGGMRGLVDAVSPWANNRRRGQLTTWLLGLFVFFDDYANTMLLGNTLRPLTDRLRISREKLAYLVDSTAAPVSGLALISTWVAGEIGFVQDGLAKLPGEWKAFDIFLNSIPYRFYVIWALLFIPLLVWLQRDFGPMLAAERRRWADDDFGNGAVQSLTQDPTQPDPATPARWFNAVVPILVTVAVIVWLMYASGRNALADESDPSVMAVFGEADAYGSLLWGALAGAVVAAVMSSLQRLLSLDQIVQSGSAGALHMLPALVILWLASALSSMTGNNPLPHDAAQQQLSQMAVTTVTQLESSLPEPEQARRETAALMLSFAIEPPWLVEAFAIHGATAAQTRTALVQAGMEESQAEQWVQQATATFARRSEDPYRFHEYRLYTGNFLGDLLQTRLPAFLLPTIIFLLSSVVAFSTGTSWGTMGIIMPLAIPLVYSVVTRDSAGMPPDHPLLLGSVGSVLAGAIFGDHCSPISDTTVLSSQASGCDHVAHVWTQMPYAMVVGTISVVAGTLPIGLGLSVWISLGLGIGLMLLSILVLGKRVESE